MKNYINKLIDTTANKHGILPVPFPKTTVRFLIETAMDAQTEAIVQTVKEFCALEAIQEQIREHGLEFVLDSLIEAILNSEVQP